MLAVFHVVFIIWQLNINGGGIVPEIPLKKYTEATLSFTVCQSHKSTSGWSPAVLASIY